jgi:FlaA1/EpsC-like NDP-sugar epimerase
MRSWAVPQHMLYWGPVSQIMNRYLSWLVVDSLVALAAVAVSGVIWRLSRPLDVGLGLAALIAVGISLAFSLMNWFLGLNRIEWSRAPASETLKLAVSTGLATVMVIYLDSLNPLHAPLPDAMILVAGILALFGFAVVRYRERLVTGFATRWLNLRGGIQGVGERVLIVGSGENGALAAWFLGHTSFGRAFSVVGIVDDDPHKQGMRIDGHPVLGTTAAIPDLVEKRDVGLVLFTIDNIHPLQRARILSACEHTAARMVVLPTILDDLKKGMGRLEKTGPETIPLPKHAWEEEFLDELHTLLEKNQVQAARQRLAAYRQEIRSRVND